MQMSKAPIISGYDRDLDSTILFLHIDCSIGLVPLSGPDVHLYPGYRVN